jgi:hypothetical protein
MPVKSFVASPTAWEIVYVKRLHSLLDQTYKDIPSCRFPGDGWECLKKDGMSWGIGQEFTALMDAYKPMNHIEDGWERLKQDRLKWREWAETQVMKDREGRYVNHLEVFTNVFDAGPLHGTKDRFDNECDRQVLEGKIEFVEDGYRVRVPVESA